MKIAMAMFTVVIVGLLSGCATPQSEFDAASRHPQAICQILATHKPGPETYLDKVLGVHSWFSSSVTSVSFDVNSASSSFGGIISCPAVAYLENGTNISGKFDVLYPLYLDAGKPKVTWTTNQKSEDKAERAYLIATEGLPTYEKRRRELARWTACMDKPHGIDPETAFADTPADISPSMLNMQIDLGIEAASTEACGISPYEPRQNTVGAVVYPLPPKVISTPVTPSTPSQATGIR